MNAGHLVAMSRSLTLRVCVLLLAGSVAASAQTKFQQDASTIDDLIAKGQYATAERFVKARLDRMRLLEAPFDETAPFLAYFGKLAVEMGDLHKANEALKAAASSAEVFYYWRPAVTREQAALYFASGDYAAAASAAAQAYKLSQDQGYSKTRVAYCQSIGALAQLRMGNVTQAEQLVLEAIKNMPPRTDASPFYVPRILFAACLVETHRGAHSEAEGYCLRGIKMAERSRATSRNLSLGHLALADFYLESGDFDKSRASALKALEVTSQLFGSKHQDTVEALQILALVDRKEGKAGEAMKRAKNALEIAKQLFGEGSPGVVRPTRTLNKVLKTSE